MKPNTTFVLNKWVAMGAVAALTVAAGVMLAQPPGGAPGGSGRGGRGGGRGAGVGGAVFTAVDTNADGAVKRDELKAAFDAWFTASDKTKSGSVTQSQLQASLTGVINKATPETVQAMMAALPTEPGAKSARARKILVFGGASGFVHSSIPLAAKMVEALGNQDSLWKTDISYDAADFNAANLKQYDAIFLDSTTGCFLDDPADAVATAARRKAFLDFVRDGKGIASIHAATDSYHSDCSRASGGGSSTPGTLATLIATQADTNGDHKVTRQEMAALADAWFDKLDSAKSGSVSQADFTVRFNSDVVPPPAAGAGGFGGGFPGGGRGGSGAGGRGGEPAPVLQWPEFNKLIGGYFKFHWSDPQLISVKIDDPKSPLTAMFHGQEFDIHDETYTFAQDSFSRKNVHVLTSIDYAKMSDADKAKEANPRTDGDYALSYIRREGKGRVFYEGHGHAERIYAITPMLEHVRAGIQYALGDLKADDSPSAK